MSNTPSINLKGKKEVATAYELECLHRALACIESVRSKLKSGEYCMEHVTCPCGADVHKDLEVMKLDRYGLPHRMVICEECALIRANPRMTFESYKSFYNHEYRHIHTNVQLAAVPIRDVWDKGLLSMVWSLTRLLGSLPRKRAVSLLSLRR